MGSCSVKTKTLKAFIVIPITLFSSEILPSRLPPVSFPSLVPHFFFIPFCFTSLFSNFKDQLIKRDVVSDLCRFAFFSFLLHAGAWTCVISASYSSTGLYPQPLLPPPPFFFQSRPYQAAQAGIALVILQLCFFELQTCATRQCLNIFLYHKQMWVTWAIEHRKIKMIWTGMLHLHWLTFRVQEESI